jgi:hypothetical protein
MLFILEAILDLEGCDNFYLCYFWGIFWDKNSASARISKGQGYQVFIRKRAGSSFGQKRTEFHSF